MLKKIAIVHPKLGWGGSEAFERELFGKRSAELIYEWSKKVDPVDQIIKIIAKQK